MIQYIRYCTNGCFNNLPNLLLVNNIGSYHNSPNLTDEMIITTLTKTRLGNNYGSHLTSLSR